MFDFFKYNLDIIIDADIEICIYSNVHEKWRNIPLFIYLDICNILTIGVFLYAQKKE